jgi:hypothetical protein
MRQYIVRILETASVVTNKADKRVKSMRKEEKDEEVRQDRLVNLYVRRG